ncbi:hypothetical protein [Venatoribacter cucullus]|uniref:hypothetical protein n=1 Tax=Venatoribacter cucullus TaxID=2661630 RepID=UPI00223E9200|nr:hypothetical protein [Venatoribacter cucullus]UZK03781.1 hypothetical protein GAY96_07695 [Venatoribacter cucullus]
MKKKVYLSIFASLILAVFVNALGVSFGEAMTEHVKKETVEMALDGRSIAEISQEEANALMQDPEFSDRLIAAKKEVSRKYWWYVGANFTIQFLLILVISLVCGKYVIHTVVRHARP